MAGDWIKIRADLWDDADVLRLSDILGTDDPTTVGLLVRFWAWVDRQTEDGTGICISQPRLDKLVGRDGFASGMIAIGWLVGDDGDFQVPNFERHNGNSSKARALESEAKRLRRSDKSKSAASDKCQKNESPKVGPEKRREEKNNTPLSPSDSQADFDLRLNEQEASPLPAGWRKMKQAEKQRRKVNFNTDLMIRIGGMMGRKPTTLWTVEEAAALMDAPPSEEELDELEPFYLAVFPPDRDPRKRQLITLLNNWNGELDKARTWTSKSQHP